MKKQYILSLIKGMGGDAIEHIASSPSRKGVLSEFAKWLDDPNTKAKYVVAEYQRFIKHDKYEIIDFGDYTYFAKIEIVENKFKNKKEEREWIEKNMLTVGKLISFLKKMDKNSIVCYFENNSDSPWQPTTVESLKWYISTAKEERKRLKKDGKRIGMDSEKIKQWLKHTKPNDILIRF